MPKRLVPPHHTLSRPVTERDMDTVNADAEFMKNAMSLMSALGGIGVYAIAHPQVEADKPLAFFCLHQPAVADFWTGPLTIINPQIELIGSLKSMREGCLTFPGRAHVPVFRAYQVKASFYDEAWNHHDLTLKGRMAQIFQHETDHLQAKYVYATG